MSTEAVDETADGMRAPRSNGLTDGSCSWKIDLRSLSMLIEAANDTTDSAGMLMSLARDISPPSLSKPLLPLSGSGSSVYPSR